MFSAFLVWWSKPVAAFQASSSHFRCRAPVDCLHHVGMSCKHRTHVGVVDRLCNAIALQSQTHYDVNVRSSRRPCSVLFSCHRRLMSDYSHRLEYCCACYCFLLNVLEGFCALRIPSSVVDMECIMHLYKWSFLLHQGCVRRYASHF